MQDTHSKTLLQHPSTDTMICIECTEPVSSLYTEYSTDNIRLTACSKCNKFADKYIEHDGVLIFIDLLLLKKQAYRHLVFNVLTPDTSPSTTNDNLHPRVRRLFLLITLFEVYLTWAQVEKGPQTPLTRYLLGLPIITQYNYFLIICLTEAITWHVSVRVMARILLGWKRPNALSTALLISSATKLLPILMIIWDYDVPLAAALVGWAVNFNVVEALTIILSCSYFKAIVITAMSSIAKGAVSRFIFMPILLNDCDVEFPSLDVSAIGQPTLFAQVFHLIKTYAERA